MKSYTERILYYWSKMYCGDLDKGSTYDALNKCIVINFLDFELFQHEKMHAVFHISEDELGTRLTDHLELHFVELPKVKRYNMEALLIMVQIGAKLKELMRIGVLVLMNTAFYHTGKQKIY